MSNINQLPVSSSTVKTKAPLLLPNITSNGSKFLQSSEVEFIQLQWTIHLTLMKALTKTWYAASICHWRKTIKNCTAVLTGKFYLYMYAQ